MNKVTYAIVTAISVLWFGVCSASEPTIQYAACDLSLKLKDSSGNIAVELPCLHLGVEAYAISGKPVTYLKKIHAVAPETFQDMQSLRQNAPAVYAEKYGDSSRHRMLSCKDDHGGRKCAYGVEGIADEGWQMKAVAGGSSQYMVVRVELKFTRIIGMSIPYADQKEEAPRTSEYPLTVNIPAGSLPKIETINLPDIGEKYLLEITKGK